jgi:hypothetical protein
MRPRRFRSIVVIAAAAMVLVATLALWGRSQRTRDGVWYTTESTRYGLHSYRGRVILWQLSVAPNPTAMTWVTPTKMRGGVVWDSTPDSWNDPFRTGPMGIQPEELLDAPAAGANIDRRFAGFRQVHSDTWYPRAQLQEGYPTARSNAIYIPWWFIALIAATPGALLVIHARRRAQRRQRGLCPACGYDLRASSGRCPECGRDDTSATPELSPQFNPPAPLGNA